MHVHTCYAFHLAILPHNRNDIKLSHSHTYCCLAIKALSNLEYFIHPCRLQNCCFPQPLLCDRRPLLLLVSFSHCLPALVMSGFPRSSFWYPYFIPSLHILVISPSVAHFHTPEIHCYTQHDDAIVPMTFNDRHAILVFFRFTFRMDDS